MFEEAKGQFKMYTRSLREKHCTKPEVFLNVLKCHSFLNIFESKYFKVFATCLNMTHSKYTSQLLENLFYKLVHDMYVKSQHC